MVAPGISSRASDQHRSPRLGHVRTRGQERSCCRGEGLGETQVRQRSDVLPGLCRGKDEAGELANDDEASASLEASEGTGAGRRCSSGGWGTLVCGINLVFLVLDVVCMGDRVTCGESTGCALVGLDL